MPLDFSPSWMSLHAKLIPFLSVWGWSRLPGLEIATTGARLIQDARHVDGDETRHNDGGK